MNEEQKMGSRKNLMLNVQCGMGKRRSNWEFTMEN